jgi:hypothetical protein
MSRSSFCNLLVAAILTAFFSPINKDLKKTAQYFERRTYTVYLIHIIAQKRYILEGDKRGTEKMRLNNTSREGAEG